MASDEYKLFLRRFVEQVWERGNLTAIGHYIATRCIYHDLALARDLCGPVELRHYIEQFRTAVRNWHFRVEDVVSEGNSITMRWIIDGVQDGPLTQLSPTGRPVQLNGITMYQLRGGKVTEAWSCWNAEALRLMRTVYCACGKRLEAPDDTALFQHYRAHVDATHPDRSYSDEQILAVIRGCAHNRHGTAEAWHDSEAASTGRQQR